MLSKINVGRMFMHGRVRLGAVKPVRATAYHMSPKRSVHYGINHTNDGHEYLKDEKAGDHSGRQQNHIWSAEEIDDELKSLYRHKPVTMSDKFMNLVVSATML